MINNEFYIQALEILADRRAKNKALEEKRRNEIAKAFPEYLLLEKQLAKTGHRLAMVILNKSKNALKEIKEIEKENLNIQDRINVILKKAGKNVDYLDSIYSCKKCQDTGIFNNKRCSCVEEIARNIAIQRLNESSPLNLSDFDSFKLEYYSEKRDLRLNMSARELMRQNLQMCRDFAFNFHVPMSKNGILMIGKTGLGKTHLSLAIAKIVIEKGYSVVYGSVPDFLRKIEKEHFSSSEADTIGVLNSCDLLILDDLGAEFDSQFYTAALYNIINSRLNKRLPVIANTNLTAVQLKDRYSDRIFSRLFSLEVLSFFGEDIRLKNH
ncbi:MAG: ATP-binding protein [Clostridiales bacterium]|nr:ATP-binding protein [Clostridiales bacterium]